MKKTKKILKSELKKIKSVRRRTGEVISFDLERITRAVFKAFEITGEGGETEAQEVAKRVFRSLLKFQAELLNGRKGIKFLPTVEMILENRYKLSVLPCSKSIPRSLYFLPLIVLYQ